MMYKSALTLLMALVSSFVSPHGNHLALPTSAPQSALPDIAALVMQSDAVFKGRVLAIEQVGQVAYSLVSGESAQIRVMSARLHLDKVIKGSEPGTQDISIEWYLPEVPLGWATIAVGDYGIFFTYGSASGYMAADLTNPWLPVSGGAAETPAEPTTAIGMVEAELANSLNDSDYGLACFAAMALGSLELQSSSLSSLEKMTATHPDARCRASALATLIAKGQRSLLPVAMALLKSDFSAPMAASLGTSSPFATGSAFMGGQKAELIRMRLLIAVGNAIQRSEDASFAVELMNDPQPLAKDEGLQGIRRIGVAAKTNQILSLVVSLLHDPSREIQWQAVMTLATLTEKKEPEWAPSYKDFTADPDSYITRWEQSWQEHLKASEQAK